MKHFFLVFLLVASKVPLSWLSYAQTELSMTELAYTVKAPYQYLDKDTTRIVTGYLIDQAVDLVKVGLFAGQALCDSNYVDAALFRDLFRTMNFAKVNDNAVEYDADSIYGSLTSSSSYVKLSSAVFNYNYIVANAISGGLIDYNSCTHRFYDKEINSILLNPYSTDYVFMFTASQSLVSTNYVVFDLSNLISYGNCGVSEVWIDYGDGDGYEPIFAYSTVPFSYSSGGTKQLKMKVKLQNNVILESHTRITISNHQNFAPSVGPPASVDSFRVSYGSIHATCKYKYVLAHNNKAVKPLIYVEGFDHPILCELRRFAPTSLCDFIPSLDAVFNNILNNTCEDYFHYTNGLASALISKEYDFFYVNWENPEADIMQNAELLKRIIQEVNYRKPSDGSGERTVIVGHSMGGLIARCALLEMEHDNQEHQVDCFVSQDAPHLGAVVPIGVQYALRDVHRCLDFCFNLVSDAKTVLNKIVGVLDCDSARQMMYTYIDNNYNVATGPNDKHQQFLSYLNDLGGFPKGDNGHPIENLTIVSGNRLDSPELSDELLTFGLFLAKLETLVTPLFPKTFSVYVNIDRDRQSGTTVSTVTVGYTHFNRVLTPMVVPVMVKSHTSPSGIDHYDTVPGSYLSFGVSPSFWTNNPFSYINSAEHMVFVPTASSFGVSNYNADFYVNPSLYGSVCPFDSYCFEEDAMRHENSLVHYVDWIAKQDSLSFSRCFALPGDSVSIINKPSSIGNEGGASSNNGIISFDDSSASFIVNGAGLVSLSYYAFSRDSVAYTPSPGVTINHYQHRYYRKHCTVLAGFPSMALSYEKLSGNQYAVSATCTSTNQEIRAKLDELLVSGEIKTIWGIKTGDNSITWTDTTSTRTYVCTALPGVETHIYMKLYCGPGRESGNNEISIDRTSTPPFCYDPKEISVSGLGGLPDYTEITSGTVVTNGYFAVWNNSNYPGTVTAPDSIMIGLDTVPLTTSITKTIGGESKTVYCFTFMGNSTIQSAISQCANASTTILVPVKIKNGSDILQMIYFPLVPENPVIPGPLSP